VKNNVVILAAGEGSRLRPYTKDKPKGMVNFYGKPLLEWHLKILSTLSIEDITLVGGYKSEKLKFFKKTIIKNSEYANSNMIWSLYKAKNILKRDTIIAYGDILYTKSTLENLINTDGDIVVSIDQNWVSYWKQRSQNPISDAESLTLGLNNNIINIGQKINQFDEAEGQYMGLIKLGQKGSFFVDNLFKEYENGQIDLNIKKDYMTDFLQFSINNGLNVKAVLTKDPWVEIDTVQDYLSEINKTRIYDILTSHGFLKKMV